MGRHSKDKGSRFERETGRMLSLWISKGHRADLFARNVLSGGQFTNQIKRGSLETGTRGDLMANNPLAFDFLSLFSIECKHYADLNFEAFVFDFGRSFLGKVMADCRVQARQAHPHVFPLLIAKMDRRPAVLISDVNVGEELLRSCGKMGRPVYHMMHSGNVCMMEIEQVCTLVKIDLLVANAKILREAVL